MVYKIYLDSNRKIELPNEYTLEERIEICEQLIKENEEYFIYELPVSRINANSACEKVKLRLSIMGEYIYEASSEGKNDTVVTQWRKHRNKSKEVIFSDLERNNNQ